MANIIICLERLIVDESLSFRLVESNGFRKFSKSLNQHFDGISRRTLMREIIRDYQTGEDKIWKALNMHQGAFAITCDSWSSCVYCGYYVLTCHWITHSFEMQSCVLDFKYFPPPHTAIATQELLIQCLKNWNIAHHVKAIMSDNASEMEPAINGLREYINHQYNTKLEKDWHICCACHVINRAASDAIKYINEDVAKLRNILKTIQCI